MLAKELTLNIPISATLSQKIGHSIEPSVSGWKTELQAIVESTPSPFSSVLEYYRRMPETEVLKNEVNCLSSELEPNTTSAPALSLELEFSEYKYKGHATHFFKQRVQQKLTATLDRENSRLQFKVLQFPAPIHDC